MQSITRAELARQLGVSRTYVTLLAQGKRKPCREIVNKLAHIMLTRELPGKFASLCMVGKAGLEPARLSAHDPKSCPSTSSGTPPKLKPVSIIPFCLTLCLPPFTLFLCDAVYLITVNR